MSQYFNLSLALIGLGFILVAGENVYGAILLGFGAALYGIGVYLNYRQLRAMRKHLKAMQEAAKSGDFFGGLADAINRLDIKPEKIH